jgi:hypothetical protein
MYSRLFWNFKKSIEEKKGDNIEKYIEKKLHIKIKNKWKKISTCIRQESNL